MRLTIFAATGGIGRHLVEQAVAADHEVTAVVRNPDALTVDVPVATADLATTDASALEPSLVDADAVVSCLGPRGRAEVGVASRATRAVVDAMKATDARRLIVVSSESMTTIASPGRPNPPRHDPGEGFILRYLVGPPARRVLLRRYYQDLGLMEDVVRDSGLDWTIVRPALLTDDAATGTYRTADGRKPRGGFRIARGDVAHFMLRVIHEPRTFGRAITISE